MFYYKIETQPNNTYGIYIGKWKSNKHAEALIKHLNGATGFIESSQSSFEKGFWRKEVLENGVKNLLKTTTFSTVDVDEITLINEVNKQAERISKENKLNISVDKPFSEILKILLNKDMYEIIEAFLITGLMEYAPDNCLNKQVDFLSRSLWGFKLWAPDQLRARWERAFPPQVHWWITVDLSALQKIIDDSNTNEWYKGNIIKYKERQTNENKDYARIPLGVILRHESVAKKLGTEIFKNSILAAIEDLKKQRESAIHPTKKQMCQEIIDVLSQNSKKRGRKNFATLHAEIQKIINGSKKDAKTTTMIFNQDDLNNISEIIKKLIEWAWKYFKFEPDEKAKEQTRDDYKKKLTEYIQKEIFSKFTLDVGVTEVQIEKYILARSKVDGDDITPKKSMGSLWLPKHHSKYTNTLIEATRALIPEEFKFIDSEWQHTSLTKPSMYGEQVSIWLGTSYPFGDWNSLIHAFSNQPQSKDDIDKIHVY